jgi:hypothetical protein
LARSSRAKSRTPEPAAGGGSSAACASAAPRSGRRSVTSPTSSSGNASIGESISSRASRASGLCARGGCTALACAATGSIRDSTVASRRPLLADPGPSSGLGSWSASAAIDVASDHSSSDDVRAATTTWRSPVWVRPRTGDDDNTPEELDHGDAAPGSGSADPGPASSNDDAGARGALGGSDGLGAPGSLGARGELHGSIELDDERDPPARGPALEAPAVLHGDDGS